MQHLRFEGEAVASVGVAHPPRTRRWPGAAASALESDLLLLTVLCRVVHQGSAGAAVPLP